MNKIYEIGQEVYFVKPEYYHDTIPYILKGEIWEVKEKTEIIKRINLADGTDETINKTIVYSIYSDELEELDFESCKVSDKKEELELEAIKTIKAKMEKKKKELKKLELHLSSISGA